MNTIMAGAAGNNRAKKYTYAGYQSERAENDLYIARDPAGSAQDNLRDLNKKGYQADRPWNETPEPLFETMRAEQPAKAETKKKQKRTFVQWVAYHARQDRLGAMMCAGLLCTMLLMVVMWGGEIVQGVQLSNRITEYQNLTETIGGENEKLTKNLELAKNGERIRNLAQNELGMLRPERADRQTIYIRTTDFDRNQAQVEETEPKLEFLDLMLGLLDVFHIGE